MNNIEVANLLLNYLNTAMSSPSTAKLDINSLPDEFKELGEGLVLLNKYLSNTQSISYSKLDNNIQSSSDSTLNQLKEQTENIIKENNKVLKRNREMKCLLNMFISVTSQTKLGVAIIGQNDNLIKYLNKTIHQFCEDYPDARDPFYSALINCKFDDNGQAYRWEYRFTPQSSAHEMIFSVVSYYISWDNDQSAVHIISDITHLKTQDEELQALAFTDTMTRLYNRHYIMHMLDLWIEKNYKFSIAFIDIDNLKYCNDELGHAEGDRYIRHLADFLRTLLESAIIGRIGGDEFLVCSQDMTDKELDDTLENIRTSFIKTSTKKYSRCFSYGTAYIDYENIISRDKLLSLADHKMYEYKYSHKQSRSNKTLTVNNDIKSTKDAVNN